MRKLRLSQVKYIPRISQHKWQRARICTWALQRQRTNSKSLCILPISPKEVPTELVCVQAWRMRVSEDVDSLTRTWCRSIVIVINGIHSRSLFNGAVVKVHVFIRRQLCSLRKERKGSQNGKRLINILIYLSYCSAFHHSDYLSLSSVPSNPHFWTSSEHPDNLHTVKGWPQMITPEWSLCSQINWRKMAET